MSMTCSSRNSLVQLFRLVDAPTPYTEHVLISFDLDVTLEPRIPSCYTHHQFNPSTVPVRLNLGQEAIRRDPVAAATKDSHPVDLEHERCARLSIQRLLDDFGRTEGNSAGDGVQRGAVLMVSDYAQVQIGACLTSATSSSTIVYSG